MVMTDPVADMLTRIRNANLAYKDEVPMPASHLKERIAEILVNEGYITSTTTQGEGPQRTIMVIMKYGPKRERTITGIKRISTPGRRVYVDKDNLPRVLGGLGIAILSTSKGLLTDRQAKRQQVGGEVLAHVW
jgi:small subunit ribosomal protein S8